VAEKILVVDDDRAFQGMLVEALADKGYVVETAASAEDGIKKAGASNFDLILHDIQLPGMSGLEALKHLAEVAPGVDVIVMTGYGSKESGVTAMQQGAYDYFEKPFSLREMEVVVRRALEKRRLQVELAELKRRGGSSPLHNIIGQSGPMMAVKERIGRVAELNADVLIMGETGTGKELVADTIHALSARAKAPFVKINCAAIPENLIESELFGHEKGAFTGATSMKQGKFELAKGGSLMLDEIGDMPLHLQPKLLRAVEQKQAERVGGSKPIRYDVRIIAATNQELEQRVRDGGFRSDLYYRLNVATLILPPCASASPTCRSWPSSSWTGPTAGSARTSPGSRPRPWRYSSTTTGRATCASSPMRWSARPSSAPPPGSPRPRWTRPFPTPVPPRTAGSTCPAARGCP
jgi:two-component system response regulator AtoC